VTRAKGSSCPNKRRPAAPITVESAAANLLVATAARAAKARPRATWAQSKTTGRETSQETWEGEARLKAVDADSSATVCGDGGPVRPASMTTSAERKALNEGKFREANEQIEQKAVEIVGVDDGQFVPFLCECPQMECTQVALLTLKEYEQIRASGRQGLAVLGHEDPTVEKVLERNERFVLTEKFGRAGEVHQQRDDRSHD
jgi:hypothetical protein